METLFKDSEVFAKERPTKLTDQQSDAIWKKLAKEIVANQWCDDEEAEIIVDLKELEMNDNGYEKAKRLESLSRGCNYEIDSAFVEWLDDLNDGFRSQLQENTKLWVAAHDIQPKYESGTELIIKKFISVDKDLKVGNKIFINGTRDKVAEYLVSATKGSNSNFIINYEVIEENCELTEQQN